MSVIGRVGPESPATVLVDLLRSAPPGSTILVANASDLDQPNDLIELLTAALSGTGIATASPVPANSHRPSVYATHPLLPPPPSLVTPCSAICLLDVEAISSLGPLDDVEGTVVGLVESIGVRLLERGWRHVAAPGLALEWNPADLAVVNSQAAWTPSMIESLVGPANVGLETHTTWANTQLRPIRVVIDAACLDGDPHTGTQHLVLDVARQMQASRPTAEITLAVERSSIDAVRPAVRGTGISVAGRDDDFGDTLDPDVVYRPYQMLRVEELAMVERTGRRRLVGQLDMIGFSNPFYHPSPALFSFARNLQRRMMRTFDGVTFISNSGREAAIAECPDLRASRLHVVSCGADPQPTDPDRAVADLVNEPFVLCLSATFWHKNRAHAIATFADLVQRHGYEGSLVMAGPEPFYGRSTSTDAAVIAALPDHIASRIRLVGRTDDAEKWWLLRHAQSVLYPSVIEGFGLVPFEAAAVGTPCLAFSGTAPREVLHATDAAIATWSVEAWSDRVIEWISNPDATRTVVEAVARTADSFTWRRCAELTWEAIDATLAQPACSNHAQDGGTLARIGDGDWPSRLSSTARFSVARVQPAVARRVRRLFHLIRKSAS